MEELLDETNPCLVNVIESCREDYSEQVQKIYDAAKTYHDGKWVMFEPTNTAEFDDYIKLLAIKRKPNRK